MEQFINAVNTNDLDYVSRIMYFNDPLILNKKYKGKYALHYATINAGSSIEMIELLLKLGININVQDDDGNTSIYYACILYTSTSSIQAINILLKNNPCTLIRNNEGICAYDIIKHRNINKMYHRTDDLVDLFDDFRI